MLEQPEANPLIETVLETHDVIRKTCASICISIQAHPAIQKRLASLLTVEDYKDLPERVQNACISYGERILRPWDRIGDALGEWESLTERLHFKGSQGILLLVDPYPGANWGHPCWIATFDIDNAVIRYMLNDFPPNQATNRQMVPYRLMQRRAKVE